ncbi:MAG TPA: 3-phosphoserine/phosphohydroxythreonine transaminase [Fimbriimonas sp.]|nr:3-phosphoserine/phosphohydroxythreonine transaminase [Fimbriimonas sp.]
MPQPYDRVFNFSAGPGTLPVEVLEQCREEMLNCQGSGMSVMEMSHRSSEFEAIIGAAESDLRDLLAIPSTYKVLFLQGGASLQFSMVPMNLLPEGGFAQYVVTGAWGKKAVESGQIEGDARVIFDGKTSNYKSVPDLGSLAVEPAAAYVHVTTNETIQGVEFASDPSVAPPLVCDMSSDILSRPVTVSNYGLIYAGAQKNMGPAGLTVVIVREDLLERTPKSMPPMLDYRLQAKNGSMYNTPPCWSVYVSGLVYKHVKKLGGVAAMAQKSAEKSGVLYDAVDGSGGFYNGHAEKSARSRMNVTFTLQDDSLTGDFLKGAEEAKLSGLHGHRSVGGFRASIYNAFPLEGCKVLAGYMADFAKRHG